MAASGYTPLSLYYSPTTGNTPSSANLVNGELAINIADGIIFYKNSSGNVAQIVGGGVINNDTTTAIPVYPLFSHSTSGYAQTVYTSNANLLYVPSTGTLQAEQLSAANGLVLNNTTISTSYTMPTGYSASSTGPITINSGIIVTVPGGSRWVIL